MVKFGGDVSLVRRAANAAILSRTQSFISHPPSDLYPTHCESEKYGCADTTSPKRATPSELAATSKACCRLQSLLPTPELAADSRACCRLQSLLPIPELAADSRA